MGRGFCVGISILVSSMVATGAGNEPRDATKLIEQLAADTFSERQGAFYDLVRMGPQALPALRKAANDPDRERRFRVAAAISAIESSPVVSWMEFKTQTLSMLQSSAEVKNLARAATRWLNKLSWADRINLKDLKWNVGFQRIRLDNSEISQADYTETFGHSLSEISKIIRKAVEAAGFVRDEELEAYTFEGHAYSISASENQVFFRRKWNEANATEKPLRIKICPAQYVRTQAAKADGRVIATVFPNGQRVEESKAVAYTTPSLIFNFGEPDFVVAYQGLSSKPPDDESTGLWGDPRDQLLPWHILQAFLFDGKLSPQELLNDKIDTEWIEKFSRVRPIHY